jgi:hypothetical protein
LKSDSAEHYQSKLDISQRNRHVGFTPRANTLQREPYAPRNTQNL